jgi:hypothetical protein
MSEEFTNARLSRRTFAGLSAAAGATAAIATLPGVPAVAGPPTITPLAAGTLRPEALGTLNPALTYMTLDAFAFFNDSTTEMHQRVYQDTTGVNPLTFPERLSASLPIPTGSTIFQLNVAYQHAPIMEIWKRSLANPNPPFAPSFQQTVPLGAGASTHTFDISPPIVVDPNTTVSVRFFASAGDSVFGVTVGYTPPTQSFLPFTGGPPRILDTRETGGKLEPGEERIIALGFPGARGAVINLTLAETEGNGGFVAVFPADIAWPGNSSINWTTANQFIANGVISAVDGAGQIKIRGGSQRTQVIIDRIGFLI